jgi:hypothetical protein
MVELSHFEGKIFLEILIEIFIYLQGCVHIECTRRYLAHSVLHVTITKSYNFTAMGCVLELTPVLPLMKQLHHNEAKWTLMKQSMKQKKIVQISSIYEAIMKQFGI